MGAYTTLLAFVTLSSFLLLNSHAQIDLTSANRRPALPGLPDWTRACLTCLRVLALLTKVAEAGFERGEKALPTDADVGTIISATDVESVWGVVPDDGQDDTEAFQTLVSSQAGGRPGAYILIQLPAGQLGLLSFCLHAFNLTILQVSSIWYVLQYISGCFAREVRTRRAIRSTSIRATLSFVAHPMTPRQVCKYSGYSYDTEAHSLSSTRIVLSPDDNTKYDALNAGATSTASWSVFAY